VNDCIRELRKENSIDGLNELVYEIDGKLMEKLSLLQDSSCTRYASLYSYYFTLCR